MKPYERQQFILDWMERTGEPVVDTLDAAFVAAYIETTGASHLPMPFGAHRCPLLGRDLSALYRRGLLSRNVTGVSGALGFPTWVYTYYRTEADRLARQEDRP